MGQGWNCETGKGLSVKKKSMSCKGMFSFDIAFAGSRALYFCSVFTLFGKSNPFHSLHPHYFSLFMWTNCWTSFGLSLIFSRTCSNPRQKMSARRGRLAVMSRKKNIIKTSLSFVKSYIWSFVKTHIFGLLISKSTQIFLEYIFFFLTHKNFFY